MWIDRRKFLFLELWQSWAYRCTPQRNELKIVGEIKHFHDNIVALTRAR